MPDHRRHCLDRSPGPAAGPPHFLAASADRDRHALRQRPPHRVQLAVRWRFSKDYQDYYYFLAALGRNVKSLAAALLQIALQVVGPQGRVLFAIDDTPSKRYGPKVEGAGIHHNPTPGPAGSKFVYGHVWVTLAWVVRHPRWEAIGLPLLARMYVRKKDIDAQLLRSLRKVTFQTKLVMAAELITWAAQWLNILGRTMWMVADGAYAKRVFLQAAAAAANHCRQPAAQGRGPLRRARAAEATRTWPAADLRQEDDQSGQACWPPAWLADGNIRVIRRRKSPRYKTFLATYKPAGGVIRVVLVKEDDGDWRAYFCTDAQATVREILEAVADRSALEQVFHDVKEVHGVGQVQTRNYWTNVACTT